MPTLSFDGSVYHSTEVDRKELVRIAPSLDVTVLMNRFRTTVLTGETHEIHSNDLPDNKASAVLLSLSSGSVTVVITDDASDTVSFAVDTTGMIIMLNTPVTALTITGVEDSVYDLIVGA